MRAANALQTPPKFATKKKIALQICNALQHLQRICPQLHTIWGAYGQ